MVFGTIAALGEWSWFVLGLVLLALEIFLPGTFFLWFGVAALATGAVALAVDWGWQAEVILFVVLALVLVVVGRRYFAWHKNASDEPYLNQRAKGFVGNVYVLGEPIVSGNGRVRIDDTSWRVKGPDLPGGARVKVVGVDGSVLTVEPAE
jgi:hypothetical protein